jgi:hypothetical protein
MATAAELRGEAQELREKLQYITNRVALACVVQWNVNANSS